VLLVDTDTANAKTLLSTITVQKRPRIFVHSRPVGEVMDRGNAKV
jgi:hypothetical protein